MNFLRLLSGEKKGENSAFQHTTTLHQPTTLTTNPPGRRRPTKTSISQQRIVRLDTEKGKERKKRRTSRQASNRRRCHTCSVVCFFAARLTLPFSLCSVRVRLAHPVRLLSPSQRKKVVARKAINLQPLVILLHPVAKHDPTCTNLQPASIVRVVHRRPPTATRSLSSMPQTPLDS